MSGNGFADISSKLAAPSKKSLFERQKQEAEAKRVREQAEAAAVYQDFVKSFDDGDGARNPLQRTGLSSNAPKASSGLPKRHFAPGARLSGPGSLGPVPNLSRKRTEDKERKHGLFTYDNDGEQQQSQEEERAVPKPTLQLTMLPPGTSAAVIKSFLPSLVKVDGIRVVSSQSGTERKSMTAIVTLAADTPAADIDTVVSGLQNRYLGYGFYLSISRHLSSIALGSTVPITGPSSLPFNAKPIQQSLSRAPPPELHRGGIPPPSAQGVQVMVEPPADIKQLKLIHKTVEAVLSHGSDFEALLMTRPEVQREDHWAWLWNSRSVGGVWYRWKLWDVLTRAGRATKTSGRIFEGAALWSEPTGKLPFEFVTQFQELVSESDYDSSDEEESGDERVDQPFLNPLHKAKLAHLLSRLPSVTARLRKGDVARVTALAISRAGRGSEEVVELMVENVLHPLNRSKDEDDRENDGSGRVMIGLYCISDILSASSTAGVRHSWRYRALFEAALTERRVFTFLSQLEKTLGWGRLRAEKWRRSVTALLQQWEGWSVFTTEAHEAFIKEFQELPPEERERKEAREKERESTKSKWKNVEVADAHDMDSVDLDGVPIDLDDELFWKEDVEMEGEQEQTAEFPTEVATEVATEAATEVATEVPTHALGVSTEVRTETSDVVSTIAAPKAVVNPMVEVQLEPDTSATLRARKTRARAEDMFADDSGGEGE